MCSRLKKLEGEAGVASSLAEIGGHQTVLGSIQRTATGAALKNGIVVH